MSNELAALLRENGWKVEADSMATLTIKSGATLTLTSGTTLSDSAPLAAHELATLTLWHAGAIVHEQTGHADRLAVSGLRIIPYNASTHTEG